MLMLFSFGAPSVARKQCKGITELKRVIYIVPSREFLEKFYNFLFLISREITVFIEKLKCRKIIINPICFHK